MKRRCREPCPKPCPTGVYDRRQASKRFLPQRQNEVHKRATEKHSRRRSGGPERSYHGTDRPPVPAGSAVPEAPFFPSLWPSCVPRSASVVKIACFKPRDNLASPIVARALRPNTQLTTPAPLTTRPGPCEIRLRTNRAMARRANLADSLIVERSLTRRQRPARLVEGLSQGLWSPTVATNAGPG